MFKRMFLPLGIIALLVLSASSIVYPSLEDDVSRRVRTGLADLEIGGFIPQTQRSFEHRKLARPVKVVIDASGFKKDTALAVELASFFRQLSGMPDIEVVKVIGARPQELAEYIKYNTNLGKGQDDLTYGRGYITINNIHIPVTSNSGVSSVRTFLQNNTDLGIDYLISLTNASRDSGQLEDLVKSGLIKKVVSAQAYAMEELVEGAVELDSPVIVGVNDQEASSQDVINLMPSKELSGIALAMQVLNQAFPIEKLRHIEMVQPGDSDGLNIAVKPDLETDLLRAVLPGIKIEEGDWGEVRRYGTAVPRGGTKVVLTVKLKEGVTQDAVNAVFREASENGLKGIVAYADIEDLLIPLVSGNFVDLGRGVYVGPSVVLASQDTSVKESSPDEVTISFWVSDWSKGRGIQNLITRLALTDPEIGAVAEQEKDVIPEDAGLIGYYQRPATERRVDRPIRVAINGAAGQTGTPIIKLLEGNPNFELVAINAVADPRLFDAGLDFDTAMGKWLAQRRVEQGADGNTYYYINGSKPIRFLNERDPSQLPWDELGVDVVIDVTGAFKNKEELQGHIDAGAKLAVLGAPAKDGTEQFVAGANHQRLRELGFPQIISAASCTTNNTALFMKVLLKKLADYNAETGKNVQIKKLKINTVHSWTASQSILDDTPKKLKKAERKKSALNILGTSTGAAKALEKIFPELEGKVEGVATRVQGASGSFSDLMVIFSEDVPWSQQELVQAYSEAASGYLKGQLVVTTEPFSMLSEGIVNMRPTTVVNPDNLKIRGDQLTAVAGYDNRVGFDQQMLELIVFWQMLKEGKI